MASSADDAKVGADEVGAISDSNSLLPSGAANSEGPVSRPPTPGAGEAVSPDGDASPPEDFTFTIVILAITTMFVFADQNVMAPNLTPIAREFKLNDEEKDRILGGYIAAAFFLIGAPVSIIVGYFADTSNRVKLMALVVVLGEVPCFLTGFVVSWEQLFWLRALTGISIGGVLPLMFSLVGDFFSAHQRNMASALIGLCMGTGILTGQMLGGLAGPVWGWRIPFLIVSIPSICLAIVVFLGAKDPPRGGMEEASRAAVASGESYAGSITCAKVCRIFQVPSNLWIFGTAIASTVPWGAISVFANDYLGENKGLGEQKATVVIIFFGVGAAIGNILGGYCGQLIYNYNRSYLPVYITMITLLGTIPMAIIIDMATPDRMPMLLVMALFGGICLAQSVPNTRAMLLNINLPETRGTAFAINNLMDDLGKGLGPLIFAFIAAAVGRGVAMNISMLLFVVTAAFYFGLYWTIESDEDAVQKIIVDQQKENAALHEERVSAEAAIASLGGHDDNDDNHGNDTDNEAREERVGLIGGGTRFRGPRNQDDVKSE